MEDFFDCIFTQRLHRFHYLHLQESRVRISEEVFEVIRSSVSGGAIVVLACIIFSLFASSPPVVNPDAAVVTMVWSYIGELIFNMLVLVGAVKMSDRVVRGNDGIIKNRVCMVRNRTYPVVCYEPILQCLCCHYISYFPENRNEQNLMESLFVWHEKSGRTYHLS